MKISKNDILFIISLIFALWFTSTGYIWVYGLALIIFYPFALISYLIWRKLRKDGRKRNQAIPVIIITGLAISIISLLLTR